MRYLSQNTSPALVKSFAIYKTRQQKEHQRQTKNKATIWESLNIIFLLFSNKSILKGDIYTIFFVIYHVVKKSISVKKFFAWGWPFQDIRKQQLCRVSRNARLLKSASGFTNSWQSKTQCGCRSIQHQDPDTSLRFSDHRGRKLSF